MKDIPLVNFVILDQLLVACLILLLIVMGIHQSRLYGKVSKTVELTFSITSSSIDP